MRLQCNVCCQVKKWQADVQTHASILFFVCSLRNSAVLQVSVIRMLGGEKVFDLILMNIFQMVSALAV